MDMDGDGVQHAGDTSHAMGHKARRYESTIAWLRVHGETCSNSRRTGRFSGFTRGTKGCEIVNFHLTHTHTHTTNHTPQADSPWPWLFAFAVAVAILDKVTTAFRPCICMEQRSPRSPIREAYLWPYRVLSALGDSFRCPSRRGSPSQV